MEDQGSLYIAGLALFEKYRSNGIGSALMDAVTVRARASGLRKVSLICFERNERALKLYQKRGFVEIDRRKVVPHPCLHYTDGDALLMRLTI